MTICILTPRFPFPENGGDVLRINNIARYLKSKGHKLVLVSFVDADDNEELANELFDSVYTVRRYKLFSLFFTIVYFLMGKPMQCGYYHSSRINDMLKLVIRNEKPDLFISHLLRMAPYLEELNLHQKSIIEMTDALSKTYDLSSNSTGGQCLMRMVYRFEKDNMRRYERHIMETFPKVVLVSQADVDYLKENNSDVRSSSLAMYTNGVECCNPDSLPKTYDRNKICFIGNMRTLQNQDAVFYFVHDILPIILKVRPNVKFYIVGAQPSPAVMSLASDHVIVTGFVDDLYATIADSCLVVAPVRVAAGIQNKVLVAMGCRIPVVLSTLISNAIPQLVDGVNCYTADTIHDTADRCLALMHNSQLRDSMAQAGYDMVAEHYSWQGRLSGYEDRIK